MQLGKATLVEVNDERNACKYEWKFVLFEFGSARDKAEAARLQSGLGVSEKRRLELEETCQSNVLEIESLKHKITTTSVEKMRGEVFLTIPLALYMVFHHNEPVFFIAATLLCVVYGPAFSRLAGTIRGYVSRHAPVASRTGRESARVKVLFWHKSWRASRIRGWRYLSIAARRAAKIFWPDIAATHTTNRS
jgi:hypothetical protein